MAKNHTAFVCQECGAKFLRWQGQCSECGAWNTLEEEKVLPDKRKSMGMALNLAGQNEPVCLSRVSAEEDPRFSTGITELDQVLGGGLVRGSVVLLGGPPGIGKSTLLLQAASNAGTTECPVLYVSGEESPRQIKLRAQRLGVHTGNITVYAETSLEAAENLLSKLTPRLVIIDSIQTMFRSDLDSAPGSVTQVRECAASLMRLAKSSGSAIILVGHVTKGGEIAGPRVLEHLVDTVLSFESYGLHNIRALRAVKNRFGNTQETGFFAMEAEGLQSIPDASSFFLAQRAQNITGSLIFPSLEGTRPVLVEVQALVSDSYAAQLGVPPTRRSVGIDMNRLGLLLAVLQKRRPQLGLSKCDIYINVAGGMRLNEPALDLPLLLAIASSRANLVIPADWAALGEVGLGGEVRAVSGLELRLNELCKMGFRCCLVPSRSLNLKDRRFKINDVGHLPKNIGSRPRAETIIEPNEEDVIGELTLGAPLSDDEFAALEKNAEKSKFAQLRQVFQMRSAAELPSPVAERKLDSAERRVEGSIFNVDKTILETTEINSKNVDNICEMNIIPVDNLQQALYLLGIKNKYKNEHYQKKDNITL
ncbi:MAG: DNA repair protein RadA [Candidatus Bruticola sp.]